MAPPGRKLRMTDFDRKQVRPSSVLLLLFPHQGRLFTCLTKRSAEISTHPGQISFPGGKIEQGEAPEVAALREAQEEVGLDPAEVQLLGRLSDLFIPVSQFVIYPFVGWIDHKPDFKLNVAEAEKLLLFPIETKNWEKQRQMISLSTFKGDMEVPCFRYENETIWGATAMIIAEFFDIISQALPTMSLKG